MKSFKLVALAFASFLAVNSFAQEKRATGAKVLSNSEKVERPAITPEQKAEQQTNQLAKKIGLSDDQKARITEINLMVNSKNQAVHDNKELTKEFRHDSLKGNNESRDYLIREELTDDQKIIFDEIQAEKKEKKEDAHDHSDPNHKH